MTNDGKFGMGRVHTVNGVTINGVADATPLKESKPKVDTTNYGSGGRQYKQGLAEADDMTLNVQYNPADPSHQALDALYDSGADATFTDVYPFASSKTATFTAKVMSRDLGAPIDNIMTRNYVLAIDVGTIVWS